MVPAVGCAQAESSASASLLADGPTSSRAHVRPDDGKPAAQLGWLVGSVDGESERHSLVDKTCHALSEQRGSEARWSELLDKIKLEKVTSST